MRIASLPLDALLASGFVALLAICGLAAPARETGQEVDSGVSVARAASHAKQRADEAGAPARRHPRALIAPEPQSVAPDEAGEPQTGGGVGPLYWGVAMEAVPWDMGKLEAWESEVAGKPVSIINWGHFWGKGEGYRAWSPAPVDNARSHGAIPMITWTPEGGDAARWRLRSIIDGSHDEYIRQFAADAAAWGNPFFLRMMHEMNGNWGYPWQEDANGNQRGEFVQAWRRIVDLFREVGVTNASYVWCPNVDIPGSPNPTFASLYPGDEYVDWTCLDGYNWGSSRVSGWQTFDQIYGHSYREILKIAPGKPVMIGEMGSVEQGGSKAAWIEDALAAQTPPRFPAIKAYLWFDWHFDGVDWRIQTSAESRAALREAVAAPHYLTNGFARLATSPIPPPGYQ